MTFYMHLYTHTYVPMHICTYVCVSIPAQLYTSFMKYLFPLFPHVCIRTCYVSPSFIKKKNSAGHHPLNQFLDSLTVLSPQLEKLLDSMGG